MSAVLRPIPFLGSNWVLYFLAIIVLAACIHLVINFYRSRNRTRTHNSDGEPRPDPIACRSCGYPVWNIEPVQGLVTCPECGHTVQLQAAKPAFKPDPSNHPKPDA